MRSDEQWNTITAALYWAVIGGLCWFCIRYVFFWLLPFLFGAAIATLLRPAALRLSARTHLGEKASSALVLTFFYLAAAGALVLFFTILLAQLYELLARLPALYAECISPLFARFNEWFYGIAGRLFRDASGGLEQFSEAVASAVQQAAVDGSAHLVGWAAGLAAQLPMLLLAAVFTIVISMLTAANYHQVGRFLRSLMPRSDRMDCLQEFLRETVWQYLRAYTIIMAITFVQLAIGLWLLRFDYVLPVAAVINLLDLLPLIGSGTVLVPWGIVLLAGGDAAGGAGLLLLFGIIAVVRNIVEPKVVGAQIGLHPIATITAMYAGLQIAGVAGMFAAPVFILLARRLREERRTSS